jgi:lipopolysaccharide export system permease protein
MSILHRYILKETAKNIALCSIGFCSLFFLFDFFDRIDNILDDSPSTILIVRYFLYKIPQFFTFTLPIASLVGTMLALGLLSKKSEFTAMRAAGLEVTYLIRPVLLLTLSLSILSIALNEIIVPYCTRTQKEIYNIDIKKKDKKGTYGQSDFWWRAGNTFFSADFFDSRDNRLLNLHQFSLANDFSVLNRTDAKLTHWIGVDYGWTSFDVRRFNFDDQVTPIERSFKSLPLEIDRTPEDFYAREIEPLSMTFLELKSFIIEQQGNGVASTNYLADLYAKLSFPFVTLIVAIAAVPFALRPARSGSLAMSFTAGLIIGFSYFVVHSFSLAMGRAELWSPILAAWSANILLAIVGGVLLLGSEAPE